MQYTKQPKPITAHNPRFGGHRQARLRETALEIWHLQMVLDDRAETAGPPAGLLREAGDGR
jgi:hypothetical protein